MQSAAEMSDVHTSYTFLSAQRKRVLESLNREQRKLELMIMESFAEGKKNMGADPRILEQSGRLDKLVVDEMELEELLKNE